MQGEMKDTIAQAAKEFVIKRGKIDRKRHCRRMPHAQADVL